METKRDIINRLDGLMETVYSNFSQGRPTGVRVHPATNGISIDLYHFEGDGLPVFDGLKPCVITCDDGREVNGDVFCMYYNPSAESDRIVFECECGDNGADMDVVPENIPLQVLSDVVAWLEKKMDVKPGKFNNHVTSFMFYMWNKWCEEECKVVFNDQHFWNKWCEAYDAMKGPRGATELFYMMLSDTNRDKLVQRALELYENNTEEK